MVVLVLAAARRVITYGPRDMSQSRQVRTPRRITQTLVLNINFEFLLAEARPKSIQGVDLKPNFWILLEMSISQSKIGEIKKKVYQEEQDNEIYPKMQ